MKTRKNLFIMISLVFLFLLGLSVFGTGTVFAKKPKNQVKPKQFVIDPPTLINLGFEWYIEGDDNHNATVEVWYREKGDHDWKEALPLLRIDREPTYRVDFSYLMYVSPNMFAGSILDLEPDTEYECKFLMSDPDGVRGKAKKKAKKTVKVRTRAEPEPFEGGNIYHVYPVDYEGPKSEPYFPNIMGAYYMRWSGTDWAAAYIGAPRVKPGDTILVHAGLYKDDRFHYGWTGMGTPWDGTYWLTVDGTPEKPIVIKAAGDGEVIFDGDGCFNLFNVMAADYNYFEGLTIRNTSLAFWAGQKNVTGSSGLTVKNCRFEDIGMGVHTDYSGSKNFYIADNVFIGKHDPDNIIGWSGAKWAGFPDYPPDNLSYYAVKVYGSGHVVFYNYVANFHDGIDIQTYGLPDGYPEVIMDRRPVSIDFYNNDMSNFHDNPIEVDGGMHNIRVLRNRFLNSASHPLCSQPIIAGPVYWIRNVVYQAPGGSIRLGPYGGGALYYHNTMTEVGGGRASNLHFRNNLILGQGVLTSNLLGYSPIFSVQTATNYSTSDYNGFFPYEEVVGYQFSWNSPPFDILADHFNPLEERRFETLTAYSLATGQDAHSILVDWDIFVDLAPPEPPIPNPVGYFEPIQTIYEAEDLNFQLKSGAVAVDAGCILPNVNDDFTGAAPDLGALEVGRPVPIYGPRP